MQRISGQSDFAIPSTQACMASSQGHVQAHSIYYGGALADPSLNAFEYNPTHLVQRTSTSSPLETLRKGAKANHCSRVGEVVAMVALDKSWPRSIDAIRSITTEIVAAIFVSAFLTSVVIALRVSVACTTLAAGELWQIILSISAAPTVLIGWVIAIRIRQTLTRIELKHEELVSSARIDGLTGLLNRPGFDAVAAEAFEEAQRSGQPVSALLCDIDAFRGLNERYGHKAGDRALKNFAEVIEEFDRTMLRNTGTTGRRRVCDPFAPH